MYAAIGLVVLVVGVVVLISLGSDSGTDGSVLIDTGAANGGWAGGSVGGLASDADVSTTTTEVERIWVQVAGAVLWPGVYELEAGTRAFQAVLEAGGFNEEADQQAVALAAPLSDGCRVYVPRLGEVPVGTVLTPTVSWAGISGGVSAGGTAGGLVSLNAGSAAELDSLPGIGPSLAQQIIDYRQAQGPFVSIEQLLDVPGIGPAKLEQIRSLVVL